MTTKTWLELGKPAGVEVPLPDPLVELPDEPFPVVDPVPLPELPVCVPGFAGSLA
jgi:hypothetical protein